MSLPTSARPIKATIATFRLQHAGRSIPFGVGCAWLADRARLTEHLHTLETAYQQGFRYYDTARWYQESEWVVGEFVARQQRESIFLATKFRLLETDDPRLAAQDARSCLEQSLNRLQTGYLDLYQIHDSSQMELVFSPGGVLDVLLEAREKGWIRNIGMAFRDQDILSEALRHPEFDTILTWGDYSPFNQSAIPLIERARQLGVGVINASPLYDARRRGLDFNDPRILAAVLLYPLRNSGIDMTLTGPGNREELLATLRALLAPLDPGLWEEWAPFRDTQA